MFGCLIAESASMYGTKEQRPELLNKKVMNLKDTCQSQEFKLKATSGVGCILLNF